MKTIEKQAAALAKAAAAVRALAVDSSPEMNDALRCAARKIEDARSALLGASEAAQHNAERADKVSSPFAPRSLEALYRA